MADLMRNAATWLAGQLSAAVSQTVTYQQGADVVEDLAVTLGRTAFRTADSQGRTRLEHSDVDFIVTAADLVVDGRQVEPKKGDRVYLGSEVYEVQPYNGEPHYRRCDAAGVLLRIHARRVKERVP